MVEMIAIPALFWFMMVVLVVVFVVAIGWAANWDWYTAFQGLMIMLAVVLVIGSVIGAIAYSICGSWGQCR